MKFIGCAATVVLAVSLGIRGDHVFGRPTDSGKSEKTTSTPTAAKSPKSGVAADVSKKRKSVPQIPNYINRLKVASGPPTGQAKGAPMMAALETHDPTHPRGDYAMLLREIVRQALLVSARDELGLPTRDRTLREPLPAAASPVRFPLGVVVNVAPTGAARVTVVRRKGNRYEVLWDRPLTLAKGSWYEQLATRAEGWSRTEFPQVLKRAGLAGKPHKQRRSAAVPAKTERFLWQWNFLAQYTALRSLHSEIKANGESPELLGGLARGYANLGTLTSFHWSPAHKVFKARALIYAERMLAKTDRSPSALFHRAYVRGLIGRHTAALKDIAAGRKRAQETVAAWVGPLEAYCRFDRKKLLGFAEKESQKAFVRYLHYRTTTLSRSVTERLQVINELLDESPDCFHAIDRIAHSTHRLSAKRVGTAVGLKQMAATLYRRCAPVDGLPANVKKLIAGRKDLSADAVDASSEIATRTKLMAALRVVGKTDTSEPSLFVLAQLIEDLSFIHVLRRVEFERRWMSSNADGTLDRLFPLVKHHPFAAFLNSFRWNRQEAAKAVRRLEQSVSLVELEFREIRMAWAIQDTVGRSAGYRLAKTFYLHIDEVPDDLQWAIFWKKRPADRRAIAAALRRISPHHPATIYHTILYDVKLAAPHLGKWEKKYKDNFFVLHALGTAYLKLGQTANAERVLQHCVKVSPERLSYLGLASVYYKQKKYKKWKAMIDASLDPPTLGLSQTRTRVKIARHFMARKEWKKAQPYADAAAAAAGGYVSWALICAGDCAEGAEDWKKAEFYYRTASMRYRNSATRWFTWCCRTRQGDRIAAQEFVLKHFRDLGPDFTPSQHTLFAECSILAGEPKAALIHFRKAFESSANPVHALHLILVAEELKNPTVRDETLKKIAAKARAFRTKTERNTAAIIREFGKCFAEGKDARLDLKSIDKLIAGTSKGWPTDLYYLVGRFLDLRGDAKNAQRYLRLAATSPHFYRRKVAMATELMRKRGWKIGEKRKTELPAKSP